MRRIAVMSDIHGNSLALAAVLRDMERREVTAIYNLGDILYGPLDMHGTFDILRDRDIGHVMGNGDRELLLPDDGSTTTMNQCRKALAPEERAWLASLPAMLEVEDILLFHGSPGSDRTYFLETVDAAGTGLKSAERLAAELSGIAARVLVCGHSHVPRLVLLPDGRMLVNAGSVGLPAYADDMPLPHAMESGSPRAKYVILEKEAGEWRAEVHGVDYDWRAAAGLALAKGRADWAAWLRSGRTGML